MYGNLLIGSSDDIEYCTRYSTPCVRKSGRPLPRNRAEGLTTYKHFLLAEGLTTYEFMNVFCWRESRMIANAG